MSWSKKRQVQVHPGVGGAVEGPDRRRGAAARRVDLAGEGVDLDHLVALQRVTPVVLDRVGVGHEPAVAVLADVGAAGALGERGGGSAGGIGAGRLAAEDVPRVDAEHQGQDDDQQAGPAADRDPAAAPPPPPPIWEGSSWAPSLYFTPTTPRAGRLPTSSAAYFDRTGRSSGPALTASGAGGVSLVGVDAVSQPPAGVWDLLTGVGATPQDSCQTTVDDSGTSTVKKWRRTLGNRCSCTR